VRLLVRDDRQNADVARAATRELLNQGVTAIVGPMTSAVAVAVLPVVEQSRAVLVSPTVSTDDLTGLDDRLLRVSVTAGACARKTARHLAEQEDLQTAVAIYDLGNEAYTRSWMDHFQTEFTRLGGTVLRSVTYVSGDTVAFHEVAQEALAASPQVLVLSTSAMDAAMLCQQFAKRGTAPRVAVSEWAATESFLELGGAAAEGVLVNQFFDRTSTAPTFLAFRTAYRTRFAAEPGFASVTAYDAANLALAALGEQQDGEDLKTTLLRLRQFQGVQGRLALDAYGESDREPHLSVVRNGEIGRAHV